MKTLHMSRLQEGPQANFRICKTAHSEGGEILHKQSRHSSCFPPLTRFGSTITDTRDSQCTYPLPPFMVPPLLIPETVNELTHCPLSWWLPFVGWTASCLGRSVCPCGSTQSWCSHARPATATARTSVTSVHAMTKREQRTGLIAVT